MKIRGCDIDPDEMEQVAELARLEAIRTGFDPEVAATKAVNSWLYSEQVWAWRMKSASALNPLEGNSLEWLPEAAKVVGNRPSRKLSPFKRKMLLRGQMILACSLAGMSQRQMADALGLPISRIAVIDREMREKTGFARESA